MTETEHDPKGDQAPLTEEELEAASGEPLSDREVMSILLPPELGGDALADPPMTTPGGPPGPD